MTVVEGDCDFFDGSNNPNIAERDYSLVNKTNSNTIINFDAIPTAATLGKDMTVYPNPASTTVQVEINANNDTNATISVLDLSGRVVMNYNLNLVKGFNQEQLNISDLGDGIYQIQIASDAEVLTSKFVKM